MNEPHDPNRTVDVPSVPADSLDAGLAAGFGRPAAPRSSLGDMRPVLLKEAEGESSHVVKPQSDAMPPKEETGDRYQLSGEIARGGMGAVLRGRDVDLGRDLAVKVLLEKYVDRPEVARRFIEEAQIGGQLQHPGVVPVYDIGRFGDRPFFTMKLVKGLTLAAILSERTDPAADRPRLLNIASQVAQAMAYAHAKGVIHRDLKPANVMVGAFGEVQVMDWGLAKVLAEGGVADEERASRAHQEPEDVTTIRTARSTGTAGSFGTETEAGSLLGTPAYMPPEQANGDIANLDRRADVFGLGAILCEILTGKPPYVGRSSEEVRRKAANGDLADATARLDACGADAELIALTKACLAAEAIDRPKDAQAVADRLTAYLNGVQERLRRAELARAAEVARTEEAQATAVQERKAREAAQARAVAERRTRRVTLALAATVTLAVTLGGGGWLWVKNERDARQAQVTRDVNEAMNKAAALRAQAQAAPAGGSLLFAQAREQAQRALALIESGPADAALATQVRQLQGELDEEEKDRKLLTALDGARLAQAETIVDENRYAKERAVPLFREALRDYGLPAGEGEPALAAARIKQRPELVREALTAVLEEWIGLALSPARPITEPNLNWLKAVAQASDPGEGWSKQFHAALTEWDWAKRRTAMETLATTADVRKLPAGTLARLARRLPYGQKRVELLRRAQQQYPNDFWINHTLALALERQTPPQFAEAARFKTAAVALRPDSPGAHSNLANTLRNSGQLDEAMACHRKAIELDPKYVVAHNGLGVILCDDKHDYDGAIACFRQAIDLDPKNDMYHHNLALAWRGKGQLDEAITCFRKVIELKPWDARAYLDLGGALQKIGKEEEAIACFRKGDDLKMGDARAYERLAQQLKEKGLLDEAIACMNQAVELEPKEARYQNNLGSLHGEKGQLTEAIACCRKATELASKNVMYHNNLGLALMRNDRLDEALACLRKAIELDRNHVPTYNHFAALLVSRGEGDEAVAVARKALELDPNNIHAKAHLKLAEQIQLGQAKLPAYRMGEFQPTTRDERIGMVWYCSAKKLYRTAASICTSVFAADPKLADDLETQIRYIGVFSSLHAAAGHGEDTADLDDTETARLRQQALGWLRANLALWTKQLDSSRSAERARARGELQHWQQDADLASVRNKDALAKLPAEEQKAFTQLWADVAALLKKAGEKPR